MSEPRAYVIGLPVVIVVHDDGTVTASVDLSEAADLHESSAEGNDPALLPADIERVQAAIEARAIAVDGAA